MAKLGIRKFQDLIGRTEFLRPREGHHLKADLLNMDNILMNASELRSDVDIRGGSVAQNFRLENRFVFISTTTRFGPRRKVCLAFFPFFENASLLMRQRNGDCLSNCSVKVALSSFKVAVKVPNEKYLICEPHSES